MSVHVVYENLYKWATLILLKGVEPLTTSSNQINTTSGLEKGKRSAAIQKWVVVVLKYFPIFGFSWRVIQALATSNPA